MVTNIKTGLRTIAETIAEWRVVGRFVKIVGAVFRLPELRNAYFALNHRQHVLETERIPVLQETISALNHRQHVLETERITALQEAISALNHRQHVLETERIPALQETISALNHHVLSSDNDRDNLVKSVPVALRKVARDLVEIRTQLESPTNPNDQHVGEA